MAFNPRILPPLVTRRLIIRQLLAPRDNGAVCDINERLCAENGAPFSDDFRADSLQYEKDIVRRNPGAIYYAFLSGLRAGPAVVRLGVTLDLDRRIQVSYETHPDFRRRGYAPEAQLKLVEVLAHKYPHLTFACDIDRGHEVSARTLRDSGYTVTGRRWSRIPILRTKAGRVKNLIQSKKKPTCQLIPGVAFTRPPLNAPRPYLKPMV